MNDKPELQLISESRNGNREAIDELFRRHYPVCVKVARRILQSPDQSMDAVQSAYLSAWRNFHSYRGDANFKTWISRIVMNQCLMQVRNASHAARPISLDQSTPGYAQLVIRDVSPTPEDRMQRVERETLLKVAAKLPPILRDALHLVAFHGLSLSETAAALALSVPTIKTRLFRARSLMRSELTNLREQIIPMKEAA